MSLRRVIRLRNQLPPVDPEPPPPVFIDETPPQVNLEVFEPLMRMLAAKYSPRPQIVVKWPWNLAEDLAINSEIVRLQRKPR